MRDRGEVSPNDRLIADNRAARFHYEISARYEAGLVLRGSEVRSLRDGGAGLADAYATVERGEVWLRQLHIAAYARACPFDRRAERATRKLLLHAREIAELERAVSRERHTLVPLALYFRRGLVKVQLGVGRGRREHDKRAVIAERTAAREALIELRARRDPRR